jgi:hypothetical protein
MHHYSESTMKSPKSKIFVANYGPELTPAVRTALVLLLQAHDTAASFGQDKWDFALEIQALKEAGLNHNDLRFLICQGIAEHLVERTQSGSKHRAFREVVSRWLRRLYRLRAKMSPMTDAGN